MSIIFKDTQWSWKSEGEPTPLLTENLDIKRQGTGRCPGKAKSTTKEGLLADGDCV